MAIPVNNLDLLNLNQIIKKEKTMDKFTKMKDLFASVEADANKFYNSGNSAAGTRVRKGMQDLKNLAQEIRTEVTAKKNSGK
ncbi:Histone H1-like protein Hc1 [Daejeonella lutea]|uniref:Histone H1-like protein Hc1 n=2 Tax=Daejeonella lutea TaxID=572036 RepID=A0A1T5F7H5_9SPHI|nr:Histone H1-like protein Hc1 [Daejeonella lutea]